MAFHLAADGTGICWGGGGGGERGGKRFFWGGGGGGGGWWKMMRIRFFGVGVGMVYEETFSPK